MEQMPTILSAGFFDSEGKFPTLSRSPLRIVTDYELELHVDVTHRSFYNGVEYPMPPGSILFARPGDRRWSTLPFRSQYVRFSQQGGQLHALLDRLGGVVCVESPEEFEGHFLRIRQYFLENTPQARIAAAGELLVLLAKLEEARGAQRSRELPGDAGELVARAREYIDAHYAEDLTVESLAQGCHVSASYLHRVFAALHTSPHQQILSRRICAAKKELIDTRDPVSQIAWRCGFGSAAYFSDCFKKATGFSPGKFRKLSAYPLEAQGK